ncbi:MAG TPA: protein kinase [Gemmatimonadales bacterium]|nr:protein kinase [Gemmatimonadales bacterium]
MIAAALGGSMLVVRGIASRAAQLSMEDDLRAAEADIRHELEDRSGSLRRVAEALARIPASVARIERAQAGHDRAALMDQADEFRRQLLSEWVILTDAHGVLQAWSERPDKFGNELSGALVGLPLGGGTGEGVWLEPEQDGPRLYQAVSVPLRIGDRSPPIGVLIATLPVNTELADTLKRNTGNEIVFFARDSLDRPIPLVRTMPVDDAVVRALGEDTTVTQIRLAAGGERWVGSVGALRTAGGYPVAGFVGLQSQSRELAPYVRLQRAITVALGGDLLLALLSTAVIVRRITRPVVQLAAATRRVIEGDYSAAIEVDSPDEIGELGRAFRRMQEELREKQRLVDFLSAGRALSRGAEAAPDSPIAAGVPAGMAPLAPGTVLAGRYELKEVLGSGGMGVVYRARDRELGEVVAVKTLHPGFARADPHMLERFKQEIRLARRITHRNVVRIHDLGEESGNYFITMEHVEGTSLDQLIQRRGRLPVDVTLAIGKQLCRALEVAHEAGVIQRDIKPQNLVVDPAGFLKVMDFGIARLAEERSRGQPPLTIAGMVVGTPEYMAPEQLLGEEVDGRADVYAAGAVLFECLTGKRVFTAPSVMALIGKQLEQEPPDPRSLNPDIPESLAQAVIRALAKDRARRWPTAAAFRQALEAVPVPEGITAGS